MASTNAAPRSQKAKRSEHSKVRLLDRITELEGVSASLVELMPTSGHHPDWRPRFRNLNLINFNLKKSYDALAYWR